MARKADWKQRALAAEAALERKTHMLRLTQRGPKGEVINEHIVGLITGTTAEVHLTAVVANDVTMARISTQVEITAIS